VGARCRARTGGAAGRGRLSELGVSVSVSLDAARRAPLVIAQVNPQMPRTRGNGVLHRSEIDVYVEVDEPLTPYPPPTVGPVERAIGGHVAGIVPDGAVVQVGVGAIPQAVLEALERSPRPRAAFIDRRRRGGT
jgi:acyl-CoA hydrolase